MDFTLSPQWNSSSFSSMFFPYLRRIPSHFCWHRSLRIQMTSNHSPKLVPRSFHVLTFSSSGMAASSWVTTAPRSPLGLYMRSEILHHLVQSGANYPFCKGLSNTLWWPNCGWGLGWNFSIVIAFRWIWFSPFSTLYSIVQSNDSLPDWCPLVFQHFAMDNHVY